MGFIDDFGGFFRKAKETDVEILTECEAVRVCSIILGIKYVEDSIKEIVMCTKAPQTDMTPHYIFITSEEKKSHPCDVIFYSALVSISDGLINFENRFKGAKNYIKKRGIYRTSSSSERWRILSNLAPVLKDYDINE